MIIVLKPGSSDADVEDVCRRVRGAGFSTHRSRREARAVIGIVGDDSAKDQFLSLQSLHCVEQAVRIRQPFKPDRFATLMTELRPLARVLGRTL